MRNLLIVVTAIILVVSFSSETLANWSQLFITDDKPNLLNLWSNKEFQDINCNDENWTSWQSLDGFLAQGYTTVYNYGIKDIYLTVIWVDSHPEPLYLAAQEVHYDFSTGSVVDVFNYGLYWDGSSWDGGGIKVSPGSKYAEYFEAAGGQYEPMHPVHEPRGLILFSIGISGLFLFNIKRKVKFST